MNAVTKRPTYSIMRQTPEEERGRVLADLIEENPNALKYFRRKNVFLRAGEIGKMVLSSESYNRKEALRASLYAVAEPHFKDGKMSTVNVGGAVKDTIKSAKEHINSKANKTEKDKKALAVLDEMLKKEVDSSKIRRDKEWLWRLLRYLAAAAAGIALMLSLTPKPEEEKPQQQVVSTVDSKYKKSLDECLNALSNYKCPSVSKVKYVEKEKVVPAEVDLDKACAYKVSPLAADLLNRDDQINKLLVNIGNLQKQIEELKKDSDKYKMLVNYLERKVQAIYNSIGPNDAADKEYYEKVIRPWHKKGIDSGDKAMIAMIIFTGGDLLGTESKDGRIVRVFTFRTPGEFEDLRQDGELIYPTGSAGYGDIENWNRRPGAKQAVFEFYKNYMYPKIKKSVEYEENKNKTQ